MQNVMILTILTKIFCTETPCYLSVFIRFFDTRTVVELWIRFLHTSANENTPDPLETVGSGFPPKSM